MGQEDIVNCGQNGICGNQGNNWDKKLGTKNWKKGTPPGESQTPIALYVFPLPKGTLGQIWMQLVIHIMDH